MLTRWATGMIFGGIALGAAWWGSIVWFVFLMVLLGLAASEWRRLGNLSTYTPDVSLLIAGAYFVIVGETDMFYIISFLPVLLVIPAIPMLARQNPRYAREIVWTAAGVVWLSLPAALIYLVRSDFSFTAVVILLVTTVTQDTLALYFGMLFGSSRNFAPGISPNKSWAGFVGSVLGSLIVLMSLGTIFRWPLHLSTSLGLLMGTVGQIGDLSISGLKRMREVKDTGDFFPGHGGILDRVDGLIFNVAVYYPFYVWLNQYG